MNIRQLIEETSEELNESTIPATQIIVGITPSGSMMLPLNECVTSRLVAQGVDENQIRQVLLGITPEHTAEEMHKITIDLDKYCPRKECESEKETPKKGGFRRQFGGVGKRWYQ